MEAPKRNRSKPSDPAFKKTREKIRTTQLVKRLECYALGEKDPAGNEVDLEPARIRAIEVLLNKTLPNLQATELSGPDGKPIDNKMTVTFVDADKAKK